MCSYTRDVTLFNYDYKDDLQKTALERDRIFVLNKIREDTEESDEEGYFDKAAPEEDPVEDEKKTPAGKKADAKKAKKEAAKPKPAF